MSYVLTNNSSLSCDHPLVGGGAIEAIASQSVLKINTNNLVLVETLIGSSITTGCIQTNTSNGEIPCKTILSETNGKSSVLKVNGRSVLIEEISGQTAEGKPDNSWSAKDANQTVLNAD